MITGFFLQIGLTLLQFFVGLLPLATGSFAFPTGITSAIQTIWYYINSVSFLLPVSTLLSALTIAMLFHGTLLLWRLAHLIGGYIRGR